MLALNWADVGPGPRCLARWRVCVFLWWVYLVKWVSYQEVDESKVSKVSLSDCRIKRTLWPLADSGRTNIFLGFSKRTLGMFMKIIMGHCALGRMSQYWGDPGMLGFICVLRLIFIGEPQ